MQFETTETLDLEDIALLVFLAKNNQPVRGKIKLMNLLFIVTCKVFPERFEEAEFFKHHFGPYSIKFAKTLNKLLDDGDLVTQYTDRGWRFFLSEQGIQKARRIKVNQEKLNLIVELKQKIRNKNLLQQLRWLYKERPDYYYSSRITEEFYGKI